jgi:hypothetical protein
MIVASPQRFFLQPNSRADAGSPLPGEGQNRVFIKG